MRRQLALLLLPAAAFGIAGCAGHKPAAPVATSQAASTSSPAPTVDTTPTSTSGATSATGLAAFVGQWGGHGRLLTIAEDGTGKIMARTYQKCGDQGAAGPCDTFDGNEIKPGAVTKIKIIGARKTANGAVADFAVLDTTLRLPPNSTGTLALDPADDTVQITINGTPGDGYYCGPKAQPGACGA